jgi:hypothetical protein
MEDTNSGGAPTTQPHEQQYIYEPLHFRDGEIRLLKISAGATLSCTTKHFMIPSAVRYKAVSYRWGTGPISKEIQMNGCPVKISDNLFDFLSQQSSIMETWTLEEGRHIEDLPSTEHVGNAPWVSNPWLWIDQLCIDQSSVSEKNHQVAQMGAIFSNAVQVLVWLGNGADGTEKAVEHAADCANIRFSPKFDPWKLNLQAYEKTQLQAFQKIVSNQYWTRLWIIQEFLLARTVVLMSGAGRLSGTDFRELARDVARLDESPAIARIWPFMTVRRRITAAHSPWGRDLPSYTWHDLMRLSRKAECKDARDRVYGMLSMVKSQVRIEVDYTATAQDIRERIVEAEFMECFDRPFSQEALEEVGDADFEGFLLELNEALKLKEPALKDPEWPHIDPLGPQNGLRKRSSKTSKFFRGVSTFAVTRFKR